VQYTSGDVVKLWTYSPILNGVELSSLGATGSEQVSGTKSCTKAEVCICCYVCFHQFSFLFKNYS